MLSTKNAIVILFLILSNSVFGQKKSKKDYLVFISTNHGEMIAVLYEQTPKHKSNFIQLADSGFYNNLLFHRVIDQFMIQGGDPKSKGAPKGAFLGNGDVGYTIPAEFDDELFHKKGALAAARNNNPLKASSGCQFYIVQGKVYSDEELLNIERRSGRKLTEKQREIYKNQGGTPHLDGNYTVFGEVIKGLEVIDSIAKQAHDPNDRPLEDVIMKISLKKIKKKKITKKWGYKYG